MAPEMALEIRFAISAFDRVDAGLDFRGDGGGEFGLFGFDDLRGPLSSSEIPGWDR